LRAHGLKEGCCDVIVHLTASLRAVGRSENPGVPVLFGGHNLPPLVEIGLTDLPKNGGAMAPPASPGTTGLGLEQAGFTHLCSAIMEKLAICITKSSTHFKNEFFAHCALHSIL
jgi:hypothetical protein